MSAKATITKGKLVTNTDDLKQARVSETQGAEALAQQLGVAPEEGSADQVAVQVPVAYNETNPYAFASGGAIEGEFGMEDVKKPQLKIVNGAGELAQKFNQGALVLNGELLWLPPNLLTPGAKNPVLTFVPIQIRKQLRENLTPDEVAEGTMPRVVNTEAEAEYIGGTVKWINNQKPRWSPSAACVFLVQEPEHQDRPPEDRHTSFAIQLDGKNWAMAMYYAGGMAWGESAKVIMGAAVGVLRVGQKIDLSKRWWTMQVIKKKAGNFGVYVPLVRLTNTASGPEVREYASNFLSGQAPTE